MSLTALDTAYTQNFDTLPSSGTTTWTSNSTVPGWYSVRTGTGTSIVADTGALNAGGYVVDTATATLNGGVTDPNIGNNTASDTDAIVIFRDGFEAP